MKEYKTALSIAGSDSSGGAGVQADLKTFTALGCYGASVLTALTAQNTHGVQDVFAIPTIFVQRQLESIFSDIKLNAIKTGMLFSANHIEVVAKYLTAYHKPIVVDPVMLAKNGDVLLKKNAIKSLAEKLLPLATLLTPNIDEAEYLLKKTINNKRAMKLAAQELCDLGSKAVLIKGGHLRSGNSDDCLYIREKNCFYWFKARRILTKNTHGTGCTLSAAITAFLAQGYSLIEAVSSSKAYITEALRVGGEYKLGKGHGPVCHFYFHKS